jgi:hypothetical protein
MGRDASGVSRSSRFESLSRRSGTAACHRCPYTLAMRLLPVLMLGATLSMPRIAGACVVRGDDVVLEDVVVRPGPVPLIVHLDGTPAKARIGTSRWVPALLDVGGAIAFKGTRQNVWYTVARSLTVSHGMVELRPGAHVVFARARGDDVIASAVVHADDVLPGEDKAPEETLGSLRIPCAALTLDHEVRNGDEETAVEDDADAADDASYVVTRRAELSLDLRAGPYESAPRVTLTTVVENERFSFRRLAESGAWMRVARRVGAVRVTGWVRRAGFQAFDESESSSGGCSGDHGHGLSGRSFSGGQPKTVYKGPVRVRVGAKVDDGSGPWATVVQSDGFEAHVYDWAGRRRAELQIPGVVVSPWLAKVHPDDVSYSP